MTNLMQRKWLWLLVGIWLVVLQSVAQTHYDKHSLQQEHAHCILCNFAHIQSAGSSALPASPVDLQQAECIDAPRYHQPRLPWLRHFSVRAPPFQP